MCSVVQKPYYNLHSFSIRILLETKINYDSHNVSGYRKGRRNGNFCTRLVFLFLCAGFFLFVAILRCPFICALFIFNFALLLRARSIMFFRFKLTKHRAHTTKWNLCNITKHPECTQSNTESRIRF